MFVSRSAYADDVMRPYPNAKSSSLDVGRNRQKQLMGKAGVL